MPIIAIDGVDGSSKTTQCALLHDHLYIDLKKKTSHYQMPGATEVGQEFRRLVKSKKYPLSPEAERVIFSVDTLQFFHEKLLNRDPDEIVVVDRWSPITDLVYGTASGLPLDFMLNLQRATGIVDGPRSVMCDLYIVLQIPSEIAAQRRHGKELDRIEAKGQAFLDKVGANYEKVVGSDREFSLQIAAAQRAHRIIAVDANQSVKEITATILGHMKAFEFI